MDSTYAVKGADFLEFMKMQVPTEEATSCIKKVVGGGTMGNWFENYEVRVVRHTVRIVQHTVRTVRHTAEISTIRRKESTVGDRACQASRKNRKQAVNTTAGSLITSEVFHMSSEALKQEVIFLYTTSYFCALLKIGTVTNRRLLMPPMRTVL